jgi:hypothetical protein
MQFAIGVTILECSFVKHSHNPLGINFFISRIEFFYLYVPSSQLSLHALNDQLSNLVYSY